MMKIGTTGDSNDYLMGKMTIYKNGDQASSNLR
jgi:hypothetical protein